MANKFASVLQSGTNNFLTSAEMLNRHSTDQFSVGTIGTLTSTSGVAPNTGSFAVNAQGSPNMTVAVSAGQAYVSATPTGGTAQKVAVSMDAAENVTISANATGGTRYDFVYIKVDADKMNNPAVTGLDAVTLTTQRSTTEATDSNGALANALLIAVVTVSNGASSISNSNISDRRIRSDRTDDGWHYANEDWAYASATTITVPTGATLRYSVGDKISFYQSGSQKFFYITGVASTVLTVTGGSDYTVANATITQPRHSTHATPFGFPGYFNFTPSWTNLTPGSGTNSGKFSMIGKTCNVWLQFIYGSGSVMGSSPRFTLPVAASSSYPTSMQVILGNLSVDDNGTGSYFGTWNIDGTTGTTTARPLLGLTFAYAGSGTGTAYTGFAVTTPFTWTTNDKFFGNLTYEAA